MTFHKTLIDPKPLHIQFDKIDRIIRIYDGTRHKTCLVERNMKLFTTVLDILKAKKGDITYILTILQKSKLIFMIIYL